MTIAPCPNCGRSLDAGRRYAMVQGFLTCVHCGWCLWPRRFLLRYGSLAAVFLISLISIGWQTIPAAALFLLPFSLNLNDLRAAIRWRRISGGHRSAHAPAEFMDALPSATESADVLLPVLRLPVPRQIRWKWTKYVGVAFLLLYVAFLVEFGLEPRVGHTHLDRTDVLLTVGVAAIGLALFGPVLVTHVQNAGLLRKGEVTTGRLFADALGIYRLYEFVDAQNRPFVAECPPGRLQNGETVVVIFYDPANPDRSVTLDFSGFKLRVPPESAAGTSLSTS